MAHGVSPLVKREIDCKQCKPMTIPSTGSGSNSPVSTKTLGGATKMGSRRIFTAQFKLQVLESYRKDHDCKGNQRATARKYGIHRRQIQKWLQCESNLRSSVMQGGAGGARGGSATSVIRDYAEASVVPSLDIGRHSVVALSYTTSTNAPYAGNPDTHHDSSSSSVSNSPVPMIAPITPPMYTQHMIPYGVPPSSSFVPFHREMRLEEPIDLSLAHRVRNEPADARVPAVKCEWRHDEGTPVTPSTTSSTPAVDLSSGTKRKFSMCCSYVASSSSSTSSSPPSPNAATPPKTVKLFKPYLDSDGEDEASSACDDVGDFKKSPTATNDPIIWSHHPCSSPLLYENNNAYAYDYNFYPSPPYHNMAAACAPPPPTYGDYMFSTWSPVDGASYSSGGSESGEWQAAQHSYSIDFKLKPIETYYQDVSCHADQCGTTPAKYAKLQVRTDKWLKQEDGIGQ
uniref:Putative dna n6-methyl adenine demethylase n=1 Tax=Nyssomyia neivai TaxID=330878 RepID=A0A1L8DFM5_9DIPT